MSKYLAAGQEPNDVDSARPTKRARGLLGAASTERARPYLGNPLRPELILEGGRVMTDDAGNVRTARPKHRGAAPTMWDNAYIFQPAADGLPERMIGTLSTSSGVKALADVYAQTHADDLPCTVLFMPHNADAALNPPQGSNASLPLVPGWRESYLQWRPQRNANGFDRTTRCANCLRFGHGLQDCVIAGRDGDITGCPACNTKEHMFDQCANIVCMRQMQRKDLEVEYAAMYLLSRRQAKPLIRSDIIDVYGFYRERAKDKPAPGPKDFALPMTRELTIHLSTPGGRNQKEIKAHDDYKAAEASWDYSGSKAIAWFQLDPHASHEAVMNEATSPNSTWSFFREASKIKQVHEQYSGHN